MTNYELIASEIIKSQVRIIGPVAVVLAQKVQGLKVNGSNTVTVVITEEPKNVITGLVAQYEYVWGKLGKLECIEASRKMLSLLRPNEIVDILK